MENLNAAIPSVNNPGNLSSHEFQRMLTSWFEEKGIVSDLRSHLRFKMVNMLKNTAIGRDINKRVFQHKSLSKQAINLIVAEFLMRSNCHYSLSIFNTEAALTNVFPEYPLFDDSKEPFRYDSENILNILELIGITKGSDFSKEVLNLYFQNEENCILSCLVMLLCKLKAGKLTLPEKEDIQIDFTNVSSFMKQVGSILLQSDLSSKTMSDKYSLMKNIEFIHNIELKNIEEKYVQIIRDLRCELSSQEVKIKEVNEMKKLVENKLIKFVEDYNVLKSRTKKMIKERLVKGSQEPQTKTTNLGEHSVSEPLLQKTTTIVCLKQHCEKKCQENMDFLERLQIENQELRRKSEEQSEKLVILSRKYKDISQDFRDYQNKLSLLNSRLNEDSSLINIPMIHEHRESCDCKSIKKPHEQQINIPLLAPLPSNFNISDSSESVTEEIIREARMRLKQLEHESRKIEENYKGIQEGLCHIKL